MEARRRTWFDDRGLRIAGAPGSASPRALPFLAGAMHYWRVEPRRWPKCVQAIRDLGFRLVETYVPWSVHDADGWTGQNDLGAFLDVVADAGLGVVLRPGPHCNAELTSFGYPERVLRDAASLAVGNHGAPVWMPAPPRAFPVPSYASAGFRAHVADWYRVVADLQPAVVEPGACVCRHARSSMTKRLGPSASG